MTTRTDLIHPRNEIMRTMERIYRYRMTTTSGGNLSIRDDDGSVWITPARVDKGSLRREDIVRVRPTARSRGRTAVVGVPFHRRSTRPGPTSRRSSTPTRSPWWRSASAAGSPTPACSPGARGSAAPSGSPRTPCPAARRSGGTSRRPSPRGFHCVVLENHGVVTGGATSGDAFERFETLEFAAKTIIKASLSALSAI